MRHVLLFLSYLLLFTPAGLVMRLARDPLRRRLHRGAVSYWEQAR